ncbi:hypothetical protein G7Y89_g2560 [Cudoniella acicularis]|uniref:non-specific serine/threonine protein kinase n=1 Tax=Cudoniella acicularis TaxID=354080 RepID=A0A8H4W604_9HELO|nr:hypothetical protein G7Y89_g2560 [Cudoniella acicularis]
MAAADPNLQWIASQGFVLDNYFSITHPSQPNYIASVGGSTRWVTWDLRAWISGSTKTIVDLLDAAGISWSEYEEDLPYSGFEGGYVNQETGANGYMRKHNPLMSYDSVTSNLDRLAKIKNFTTFYQDLEANTLPQWMFITPKHDIMATVENNWDLGNLGLGDADANLSTLDLANTKMGDNGGGEDGWHLVAAHPAIEIREQKQIAEWELSDKSWSGQGKHPTNWADHKTIRVQDRELGAGSYGHVERIIYKAVTMARKHVLPKKRMPVDKLREEASVMERLDHKHILKLVGTYTLKGNGLFLLLYPAAVCDLSTFLEDVDDLRSGNCADREDTLNRLRALGLNDVGTIEDLAVIRNAPNPAGTCPRTATAVGFLQQILGCITEAVAWIHKKDIRHRDLKPKNILLSPGRVYLADFGIARDVRECENSLTFRRAGTLSWIAPEVFEEETHHMSSADIWALGSIFLNITTMLYGERLERFEEIMKDRDWPDWEKKYQMLPKYLSELRAKATSAKLRDHQQPDFNVKNIIDLIDNMLEFKAERRPCATEVISRLSELGGLDQIYHLPCCHKSNKEITAVINNKLKLVSEKNTEAVLQVEKLKAENEKIKERLACLEEIQSTWERRLANELKHAGDQYKVLQDKYNKEIETQKKLEEKIKTTENKPFRRPRSQNRAAKSGFRKKFLKAYKWFTLTSQACNSYSTFVEQRSWEREQQQHACQLNTLDLFAKKQQNERIFQLCELLDAKEFFAWKSYSCKAGNLADHETEPANLA